jgi:glycosyltransferase involved in cell wall biosynthesis
MKLAILGTRGIPARYGGFETFAEELSTNLVGRGVQVTVFCPSANPQPDSDYHGVILRFVKFPELGKYSEMIWDACCYCVARNGYDIVYMLGLGGAFTAWVPRLFGTKVWVNTDGIEWKRTKFTWPQRTYLAIAEALSVIFASHIVADADAIQSYLRTRYPWLKRVSTIAYGADIPTQLPDRFLIERFGLLTNGYYLLVCRLEPENHVLEIIDGFERAQSSLPLMIVGGIDRPNSYVQRLLRHRSERVRFVGTIYNKEELTAVRMHARAYFHGHSVGGTNPSLLEAMACSNLVLAHRNRFNQEVLGDAGLFFDSSEELAKTVEAIDRGIIPVHNLRVAAKRRVAERYTWDRITEQYFELINGNLI